MFPQLSRLLHPVAIRICAGTGWSGPVLIENEKHCKGIAVRGAPPELDRTGQARSLVARGSICGADKAIRALPQKKRTFVLSCAML
jgi:hypothetical protein